MNDRCLPLSELLYLSLLTQSGLSKVLFVDAYCNQTNKCIHRLSASIGLMWDILSYPDIPSTAGQWLWILALALPLQLAREFVGELLWNNKATRVAEQETAAKSFSLLRIFYGVLFLLVFVGLTLGVGYGGAHSGL